MAAFFVCAAFAVDFFALPAVFVACSVAVDFFALLAVFFGACTFAAFFAAATALCVVAFFAAAHQHRDTTDSLQAIALELSDAVKQQTHPWGT